MFAHLGANLGVAARDVTLNGQPELIRLRERIAMGNSS